MNKITFVFLSLSLAAFGMSYAQFKAHSLKHAKALQSQALETDKTQVKSAITLRTINPTIELEIGQYSPRLQNKSYGYSISASQTVRTSSYLDALKQSADAKNALSQLFTSESRAKYIKTLEQYYTAYVYQSKLFTLLQEEIKLSRKITRIVKERYANGSESKVTYLQAKTQSIGLKTQLHSIMIQRDAFYYKLLTMGGYTKKIPLSKTFIYHINTHLNSGTKKNIQEQILRAKNRLYASELAQKSKTFTSYDIIAGLEKEPEQSILHIGFSVPLPLHHNKGEEKALAKLQMQQLSLDQEHLSFNLNTNKKMLRAAIKERIQQHQALKILIKEQQSLSNLLAEGYKIAQGSLFELMQSKNRLIQTKKQLLQTKKEVNMQKIELRYLQGAYND